jgi:hypothetical protein
MKTTVMKPVEIEIKSVRIIAHVDHGDEDMPYDFPFRNGDSFSIIVGIDSGKIVNWPQGQAANVYLKVVDRGSYFLLDAFDNEVAAIESDYVPHGVVPGEYGDYLDLQINGDGVVTNWPKEPDVSEFFPLSED